MELESEEEEKENGDQTSRADTHDKCHIMKELWLEGRPIYFINVNIYCSALIFFNANSFTCQKA